MELFKSISKSVLKNFVQLAFLIVLIILSTASMVAFSETSNSVKQESNSIRSTSKGSDFAIDLDRIEIRDTKSKDVLRSYLDFESNIPEIERRTLSYTRDGIDYSFRTVDANTFSIISRIGIRTLKYTDSNNFNLGLEQLFRMSVEEIKAVEFSEGDQTTKLTTREATIFVSWLTELFSNGTKRQTFLQLDSWAAEYGFTYSYMQSLVFTTQKATGGNTSYVRLFPTITDKEKPYSLNLIEGKYPGTSLSPRFSSYPGYNNLSSPLDFYNFCTSLNTAETFADGIECYRELKTQVVLSKNYAETQGIKVGDKISIAAVNVTVVGIGESRNVEFPSVVPTYLVPFSNQVGVGWVYDNNQTDETIYSFETIIPASSSFLPLNSIFRDNYIYGKFELDVNAPENSYLLNDFESSVNTQSVSADGQKYFYKSTDSDYPIATNITTLSAIVDSLKILGYIIVGLVIGSMVLVSAMATKSMVQEARARLAVMKAIGYKQSYILTMYSVVPLLLCCIATIAGYFIGVELLKILISFISPFMLNPLSIHPPSIETLLVIILVPLISLGLVTIITTYLLIKEPPSQSLKLHENKKPSRVFKYTKSIFPGSRRSSRLSFSLFVSSFGKLIALNMLLIISTATMFSFMATTQVFADYSDNYKLGKNYEVLYYYNQPTWNIPITHYTKHNEDLPKTTYGIIDLPRVQNNLEGDRSVNAYSDAFNELIQTTWFKDKEISLTTLGALDNFEFPDSVSIGGQDFSYSLIKNLFCTSLLGYYASLVDLEDYTITRCLNFLFDQNLPAIFAQKIQEDPTYALTIGRVYFKPSEDELFTWTNAQFESKGATKNSLVNNNNEKSPTTKILGLDYDQTKISLKNKDGENLFPLLESNSPDDEGVDYIPIIINKSLANNLDLTTGEYVKFSNLSKELVDINKLVKAEDLELQIATLEENPELNTNEELKNQLSSLKEQLVEAKKPLYGIVKDENGIILKTAGEMTGTYSGHPDGQVYSYYNEEIAKESDVIQIATKGGISTLGWSTPDSYIDKFKDNSYQVREARVEADYRVVGITENLDLGQNFAYTLREYHNETLKYPPTAFSGKITVNTNEVNDFLNSSACVTNEKGLYAQNSFVPTSEYSNPLTPCIFDAQVVPIVSNALSSLSDIISPLIYVVLGLFSLLTIIVVYIVNDVISKASRKITITLRALGYKTRQIFSKLALIYIPIVSVSITLTLVTCYLLIELLLHDFLKENLFDVPIEYRWWYFVGSGVLIFTLFFIIFIINFFKVRSNLIGKKKRK